MREIRFRAWDAKENKMWNENHVVVGDDVFLYGGHNTETLVHSYVLRNDLVLMQSTGLHDKNGKPIYEGDILALKTFGSIEVGDVRWDSNRACFYARFEGLDYYFPSGPKPERVEVIGNIYSNPELLTPTTNTSL